MKIQIKTTFNSLITTLHDLPSKDSFQKGLLVTSSAAAIMSVIPSLRLAGGLTARSIALFASAVHDRKDPFTRTKEILNISKIGVGVLGIAGLAFASPMVVAAAIVSSLVLQAIDFRQETSPASERIPSRFAIFMTDSLTLGAIVLGSWHLMAAAAAINVVSMTIFALTVPVEDLSLSSVIESICYLSLTVIGMISLFQTLKITSTVKTNSEFLVKNETDKAMFVYDKKGHVVVPLKPGQQVSVSVPYNDTLQHQGYTAVGNGNGGVVIIPISSGSYIEGMSFDPAGNMLKTKFEASRVLTENVVAKVPMPVSEFLKLPLSATVSLSTALRDHFLSSSKSEICDI